MAHIISQLLDIAELDSFVVDPDEKADLQVGGRRGRRVRGAAGARARQGRRTARRDRAGLGQGQSGDARAGLSATSRKTPSTTRRRDRPWNSSSTPNGTVSVLDHGPGIAEDERNLIFRRFWRRDRRKAGSTGLGLSIVQRIAELHSRRHHRRKPQAERRALFPEACAGQAIRAPGTGPHRRRATAASAACRSGSWAACRRRRCASAS